MYRTFRGLWGWGVGWGGGGGVVVPSDQNPALCFMLHMHFLLITRVYNIIMTSFIMMVKCLNKQFLYNYIQCNACNCLRHTNRACLLSMLG